MSPRVPDRQHALRFVAEVTIVFVSVCAAIAYLGAQLLAVIAGQQQGVF